MVKLKSGQNLSTSSSKGLTSGYNLTTGTQGKFNKNDYDNFINQLTGKKVTTKNKTSDSYKPKKLTKSIDYSGYSSEQLTKMKKETQRKMNKASGSDTNSDGKISLTETLKSMFSSAFKQDKNKEYKKNASQYEQISNALDDKHLAETKYDKGLKGKIEKASDVALGAADTTTKSLNTLTKKISGKEITEADYKPTLAERQSSKIQSEAGTVGKIAYGLENSIIRMIPAAMTGNPTLALGVSFANYGGSAYNQAREEGYSDKQATQYGVIIGGLEATMEKILGGMTSVYGKSTAGKISENILTKIISNPSVRKTLSSMTGEFTEEYLQEFLEPVVRNAVFDENNDINFFDKQNLYSGLMGALSAGVLEGSQNLQTSMNLNAETQNRISQTEQTEGRQLSKQEKTDIKKQVYSEYEAEVEALEKQYSTKEQIKKAQDKLIEVYENVTDNQNRAKIQNAMSKLQDVETRIEEKQKTHTVEDVKSDIKQDVSINTIKNNFKTTDDYKKAGFMLSDGTMIDLSKNSNKRNQDHRIISKLYSENAQNKFKQADYDVDTSEGTSALIDFVKQGNIRMSPETNGLEIGKMPTDSQLQSIENYVKDNDGNVIIEYTTDNKTAPISQKYENSNATKIINDIKNHFNTISETKKSSDEVLKVDTKLDSPRELKLENTKVPEVLKELPKDLERRQSTISEKLQGTKESTRKLLTNFVSAWYPFESFARKTGNKEILPALNNTYSADTQAQFDIDKAQRNIKGNVIGKSLNEIFKPIEKSELTHEFGQYSYLMRQATKQVGTADVFGEQITSEKAKIEANKLLKKHPEFKEWHKDVLTYEKNLRNMLVESGLLSQKSSDYLEELYPDYVRIYREVYKNQGPVSNKNGRLIVNSPVKTAKGGTQNIIPLKEALAKQTIEIRKSATKNMLGQSLYNAIGGQKTDISKNEIDNNMVKFKDGQSAYVFYENGKQTTVPITDEMYNALKTEQSNPNLASDILKGTSKIQRKLITDANIFFAVLNVPRDIGDAFINSKHPVTLARMLPVAFSNMVRSSESWKQYNALGGGDVSVFDTNTGFKKEASLPKKILRSPISLVEFIGEHGEQLTRYAEYLNTLSHGGSEFEAMYDAAEVTVNFKKGGKISKKLSSLGANYLNASILGTYKAFENVANAKGGKGFLRLASTALAFSVAPAILNALLYKDDDDYDKLSDEIKEKNYLFKVGKEFIKIPKGRLSSIISRPATRTVTQEKPSEIFDKYGSFLMDQIGPNNPITSNLFYPIANVVKNGNKAKNFFGNDIVPTRYKSGSKTLEEQWKDASITSFARQMSKGMKKTFGWNVSPFLIDYLYDNYTGVIGDITTPMMTDQADKNVVQSKFIVDSITNNKYTNKLYELVDKYEDPATNADTLKYKYLYSKMASTWDIYKEIRDIQGNNSYSQSKKKKLVDEKRQEINKIAEDAVKNYDKTKDKFIGGVHYKQIGENTYKYNKEESKWEAVRSVTGENQVKKMKEYKLTELEYSETSTYKAKLSAGSQEKYSVHQDKITDIRAKYDNTQARKNAVINYINGIKGLSVAQKGMLIKEQYPSIKIYDAQIRTYINSQKNISSNEKKYILSKYKIN